MTMSSRTASPLLHTPERYRQERRYKRVRISLALLQALVTQDSASCDLSWGARCVEGLPPDARLVHALVEWEGTSAVLVMIVEHAAFEPVPEGQPVPDFVPRFQQERRQDASGSDGAEEES